MDRDGEVEFLTGTDGTLPGEPERVAAPTRAPVSRRTVLGGLILVVLVALAGARMRDRGPDPSKSTSAPTTASAGRPPLGSPAGPVDEVPLPRDERIADMAVHGNRLYVLQSTNVSVLDTKTLRPLGSIDIGSPTLVSSQRIVLDPGGRRMWVTALGLGRTLIVELDAGTLQRVRSVTWNTALTSTAALDEQLYFTSERGLAVLGPHEPQPSLLRSAYALGPVAADPQRRRLLLARIGDAASSIEALAPDGRTLVAAQLPITRGDIAVTDGRIFVAGFGPDGAVLQELDPQTLRGGRNLEPAQQLDAGALIAGVSPHSIWLRSAARNKDVLWCRSVTGDTVTVWTAPGQIAPTTGVVFVADDQTRLRAMRIIGDGCK